MASSLTNSLNCIFVSSSNWDNDLSYKYKSYMFIRYVYFGHVPQVLDFNWCQEAGLVSKYGSSMTTNYGHRLQSN